MNALRLKRKLQIFVFLIVGLGAAVLFLATPSAPPDRPVTSGFLGFTNLPTGPAAFFAVTNYPEGATYPAVSAMAIWQGGRWNEVPPLPVGGFPWQFSVGGQPEVIYRLCVPGTNEPVRVVMQVRTPQRGFRATIERLVEGTGLRGGHPLFRPPTVYFTNETVVGGAVFQSGKK
jgi:hypothetical protein